VNDRSRPGLMHEPLGIGHCSLHEFHLVNDIRGNLIYPSANLPLPVCRAGSLPR
jgi:hypothetical protein